MTEKFEMLTVETIDFDTDNPRIKKALEKYGDGLNAERIHFALRSATEESNGASSYNRLRGSIRANGGITVPITVNHDGKKLVCIDGNTRLAIYKELLKEGAPGNWSAISAIVLDDARQEDIEAIRVSAHLVGAREWPAYEKARYLHYLRNQKFMDYDQMIALCGGNRKDIERRIEAYHDMNEYYRDLVDDTAFHIDRFSGFVELQKPGIKEAIFEAGLEMEDFGGWIRDGKIYSLRDVRDLPKVLRDEEAKEKFLEGGLRSIEDAIKICDDKTDKQKGETSGKVTLRSASIYQLTETLARRIADMPLSELRHLMDREHDDAKEQVRALEDLEEQLQYLLSNVSK